MPIYNLPATAACDTLGLPQVSDRVKSISVYMNDTSLRGISLLTAGGATLLYGSATDGVNAT